MVRAGARVYNHPQTNVGQKQQSGASKAARAAMEGGAAAKVGRSVMGGAAPGSFAWHFDRCEVKTVLWLVIWAKWLSDYALAGGWSKDDEENYSAGPTLIRL